MWEDIKNIIGWLTLAATVMMVAALFTGMVFVAGWMNGMRHFVVDMGLMSVSDLSGNEAILYGVTAALMVVIIYITVKLADKWDSLLLFLIVIFGGAAMVAGPYFYHIYAANEVWLRT